MILHQVKPSEVGTYSKNIKYQLHILIILLVNIILLSKNHSQTEIILNAKTQASHFPGPELLLKGLLENGISYKSCNFDRKVHFNFALALKIKSTIT
jgi:hypothetical protein